MRVFFVYGTKRVSLELREEDTILLAKNLVRETLFPFKRDGEHEVLEIKYAGAYLNDEWCFSDVGILQGSTVYVEFREEMLPYLIVYCHYNKSEVRIVEKIDFMTETVAELKTRVCLLTGLPVTVYRLVTENDLELFDTNTLTHYDLSQESRVLLKTWDGWNKLLNASAKGYTSQVLSSLSADEPTAKFQLKTALHIAAHFGHIDLATTLLEHGIRADEPIGEHPSRVWCHSVTQHVDSLQAPIHIAAQNGRLALLRAFVHHNICSVLVENGHGLKALNIALRRKLRPCASFLLTKQWSKIQYSANSMPLNVYHGIKKWAERAKERASYLYGPEKSSLKRKSYHTPFNGALVGTLVSVDGFRGSRMNALAIDNVLEAKIAEQEAQKQADNSRRIRSYFEKVTRQDEQKLRQIRRNGGRRVRLPTDTNSPKSSDGGMKLPPIEVSRRKSVMYRRRSTSRLSNNTTQESYSSPQTVGPISQKREMKLMAAVEKESEKSQSPQSPLRQTTMAEHIETLSKKQRKYNAFKKSRKSMANIGENSLAIALPIKSDETQLRPYIARSVDDPAITALLCYEKYRGCSAHEFAVKCLAMANKFTQKPWLQQVRIAIKLSNGKVKRTVSL